MHCCNADNLAQPQGSSHCLLYCLLDVAEALDCLGGSTVELEETESDVLLLSPSLQVRPACQTSPITCKGNQHYMVVVLPVSVSRRAECPITRFLQLLCSVLFVCPCPSSLQIKETSLSASDQPARKAYFLRGPGQIAFGPVPSPFPVPSWSDVVDTNWASVSAGGSLSLGLLPGTPRSGSCSLTASPPQLGPCCRKLRDVISSAGGSPLLPCDPPAGWAGSSSGQQVNGEPVGGWWWWSACAATRTSTWRQPQRRHRV